MNSMVVINCLVYIFLTIKVVFANNTTGDIISNDVNREETKLVTVVFRHGDRAPDLVEMFPTDPNFNNTFYPEGLGGLTNNGKRREFELGKQIKRRFGDFLGNEYLPESVYARSTDYVRTKQCLQLVLAALYPPQNRQIWNKRLLWQPIPTSYVTSKNDWLMIPEKCPEYLEERRLAEATPNLKSKIESFKGIMKNLTILTGKNISTPTDLFDLYHLFVAESAMGLPLAKWAYDMFPDGILYRAIQLEYEIFSYTTKMRRLNGGKLLYQLIDEMNKVRSGSMHKNRKINLYAGHETNIAALLQALGIFYEHVPAYSSAVVLELVLYNNEYHVKIFHYQGIPEIWEQKRINGCDFICPFSNFINILKDVIPTSDELECDRE